MEQLRQWLIKWGDDISGSSRWIISKLLPWSVYEKLSVRKKRAKFLAMSTTATKVSSAKLSDRRVAIRLSTANWQKQTKTSWTKSREQLTKIWERMQQAGFLSWKINPSAINDTARDFADLSTDDTRRFLIESLDNNLLYIPLSEIDNTEFAISDSDKKLNSQFYGGRDKKPWEVTCNCFVAFLDIMGFKDMVTRKTHEEVYRVLNGFSKISEQIERIKPVSELVYITKFSDSIVIFLKDDDVKTFGNFIAIVNIIFAEALIREIPIKGGIARGKISVNKSGAIFFGQPIIDAYLLGEDVYHYGIACHNTIDNYINKSIIADYNLFGLYLEKTILKSGNITHLMCDWYKNTNSFTNIYPDKHIGIKEIIKKLYLGVSGAPRRYIDNTLELYDRYLKTQEPHKDERDSNI